MCVPHGQDNRLLPSIQQIHSNFHSPSQAMCMDDLKSIYRVTGDKADTMSTFLGKRVIILGHTVSHID
jgi:hypothetical protein